MWRKFFSSKNLGRTQIFGSNLYLYLLSVPELSVLLGITAGGTLKIWRISPSCRGQVQWEEESKQLRMAKHPIRVQYRNSFLLVICRKLFLLIDSSDFSTIASVQVRIQIFFNKISRIYASSIFDSEKYVFN